jgi:hypothetical protein
MVEDSSFVTFTYETEMNRIRIGLSRESSELTPKIIHTNDLHRVDINPDPFMYVHIARPDGTLLSYEMTEPGETTGAFISDNLDPQNTIRVHWKGKTHEMKIGDIINQKEE